MQGTHRTLAAVASLALSASAASAQVAQDAYLKAVPNNLSSKMGIALALSGSTLVAGASEDVLDGPGEVHVFVHDGAAWQHQARLTASNADDNDFFGYQAAIDGDTIVVGAQYEDGPGVGVDPPDQGNSTFTSGAAYVFVRSGTAWTQQAYLKASNTDPGDVFGSSVAISGDTIVVAAESEDSSATGVDGNQLDGSAMDSGAAYVFVRSGTAWSQQAYLKASNTETNDVFGRDVAISGDTIVVGAYGEDSGATGPGGDQEDDGALEAGAAYVFVRSGTAWTQQAYLKASNTDPGDRFGNRVAISGDTIAVASLQEDSAATGIDGDQADNSESASGATYVFTRSGTTWSQEAYVKASNTEAGDGFGLALSLAGDRLLVGAWAEDSGAFGVDGDEQSNVHPSAGAAYLYERSPGGAWSQQAYLKASNTGPLDYFGRAVAVDGPWVAVGASGEDSSASGLNGNQDDNASLDSGAVYVFEAEDPPVVYCTAKASSAGCLAAIATTSGAAPISGTGGYDVLASGVHSFKNGLLFAGVNGPSNAPFSGGILCVAPPLKRGPVVASGGVGPNTCTGAFATEVNDGQIVPAGLDAGPGNSGWYQYWYRDPQNGAGNLGTALSDAVRLDFE